MMIPRLCLFFSLLINLSCFSHFVVFFFFFFFVICLCSCIRKAVHSNETKQGTNKKNQRANAIIITSRYNMTLTLAYFIFISLIFHSLFFSHCRVRCVYSSLSLSSISSATRLHLIFVRCALARSSSITTILILYLSACSSESVFTHSSILFSSIPYVYNIVVAAAVIVVVVVFFSSHFAGLCSLVYFLPYFILL